MVHNIPHVQLKNPDTDMDISHFKEYYAESDELESVKDSSDDDEYIDSPPVISKNTYPTFDPNIPHDKMEFVKGMKFGSARAFKNALTSYVVGQGVDISKHKNDLRRVVAK